MKQHIEKYVDGSVAMRTYYKNGKIHRDNGPAQIEYAPDGSIELETYYKKGKIHRDNGPAHIQYNANGTVDSKHYFDTNGVEMFARTYTHVSKRVLIKS